MGRKDTLMDSKGFLFVSRC